MVLSSSIPNAFALPGGKVYLLDGLLHEGATMSTKSPACSRMNLATRIIAMACAR